MEEIFILADEETPAVKSDDSFQEAEYFVKAVETELLPGLSFGFVDRFLYFTCDGSLIYSSRKLVQWTGYSRV